MKHYISFGIILLFGFVLNAQPNSIGYSLTPGSGSTEICITVQPDPASPGFCIESGNVVVIIDGLVNVTQTSFTSNSWQFQIFPTQNADNSGQTFFQLNRGTKQSLPPSGLEIFCFTVEPDNPCIPTQFINVSIPSSSDGGFADFLRSSGVSNTANSSDCGENSDGRAWDRFGSSSIVELICTGNPTPVELTYFTAEAQSSNTSLLQWETAAEIDNDFFSIEHSANGADFVEVGQVKGVGTTTETHFYRFVHESPARGANYYRLRQVDFDGDFEYSNVEVVTFGDIEPVAELKLYPNPANHQITVASPKLVDQPVDVEIRDTKGQLIMTQSFDAFQSQQQISVEDLAAGQYLIRMTTSKQAFMEKFVVTK